MAHHGSDPFEGATLKDMQDLAEKLGATGGFPDGKLTPTDEGELRFAVCVKDGRVVFEFGKPVAWIGFTPEQAREIAVSIREAADHIETPPTIVVVPG